NNVTIFATLVRSHINPERITVNKGDKVTVVLWFVEDEIEWADKAIIWVTDVKTGKWVNAREAKWSTISITPMAFGFAAHEAGSEPKGEEVIGYDEMAKRSIALEMRKKGRGR
ncbi:MAG TPA: hypothetical protein EYH01_09405, partial [Campylobacterales bacterium]|nr:hypothetical protein [Campylobacterales bacterium]